MNSFPNDTSIFLSCLLFIDSLLSEYDKFKYLIKDSYALSVILSENCFVLPSIPLYTYPSSQSIKRKFLSFLIAFDSIAN